MSLIEKLDNYTKNKIDEGKNKYEKYFDKDMNAFFELFDKYRTIIDKDFYEGTLIAYKQLIKYAKRMDIEDVPAHLFRNNVNLLVSILTSLKQDVDSIKSIKLKTIKSDAFKSLSVQVDAWIKDIKKDYNHYINKILYK